MRSPLWRTGGGPGEGGSPPPAALPLAMAIGPLLFCYLPLFRIVGREGVASFVHLDEEKSEKGNPNFHIKNETSGG